MGANFSNKDIRDWLEKPDNRKRLSEEAKRIFHKIKMGIIPPVFGDRNSIVNEPSRDIIAIIESELVIFLYKKRGVLKKLLLSDNEKFGQYLITAFRNHCIDIVRKKDIDPRKYLYKRLSDVLRESEQIYTSAAENDYIAFSCKENNQRLVPLTLEDLNEISFPTNIVKDRDYKFINRKKVFLQLSEYFWKQVMQRLGGEAVWLNVWSLIEWIGLYVRWDVTDESKGIELHQPMRSSVDNDKNTTREEYVNRLPDPAPKPDDIYFDPDIVAKWAGCFAERLSHKEKAVFYFNQVLDLGFEEIASKLNYRGASGPYYLLKQTEIKLKRFLRDLDWLNPEDMNEEAFSLFYDTLISILKKSVSES